MALEKMDKGVPVNVIVASDTEVKVMMVLLKSQVIVIMTLTITIICKERCCIVLGTLSRKSAAQFNSKSLSK